MPRCYRYMDTTDIIKEVKKRPAIFMKADPDRYRPNYREELWLEIATSLYPEWDESNEYEKKDKVADLKKKWRNLRDSFMKELQYRARVKAGLERKRKRKYVYFDQLKFLQPVLEGNIKCPDKQQNASEQINDVEQSKEKKEKKTPKKCKETIEDQEYEPKKKVRKLSNRVKGCIDEDKTFLLSLVPSFRTMQEEQKLIAKIEILNIIRQIKSSVSEAPDSSSNSRYILASTSTNDPIKLEDFQEGETKVDADSEDMEDGNFSTDSSNSSSDSSSD